MSKRAKVIGTTIAGIVVTGIGAYTIAQGVGTDAGTYEEESYVEEIHAEENSMSDVIRYDIDDTQEKFVTGSGQEFYFEQVSIHPDGHGSVFWTNHEKGFTARFEISQDADIEFFRSTTSFEGEEEFNRWEVVPEGEIRPILVDKILEEFEANPRAIHVMAGEMEEDLNEGFLAYISSRQLSGEMRFTVEDDEIVLNESDWDALPETDEETMSDFEAEARRMVDSWERYYEE